MQLIAPYWNELSKRIVFGSLLAAIALLCTLYHPLSFYALILVVALLMYNEWLELTRENPMLNRFGGLIYIGVPVWSMIALRGTESPALVLGLFAIVWATDIAAYFGGKHYGQRKLAPTISPGKTWEGLAFGVIGAAAIAALASFAAPFPRDPIHGLLVGSIIAIVSQLGDLFESWLKRRAGVKDSGDLIPGHGGILDRVDGLVFAAPVFAVWAMLT